MSRLDSFQDLADRKCQVTTIIIAISLVFWLSGVPIMRRYFGKTRIQELTCHSPLCVSLQDAMRDLLTTDVDPCEDFYTYVCGRWTRHATRYSSFHEDHRRAAKSAVHTHFMASHNPERERSVHASMSTLYRNCIDHVGKQKTVRQIMAEVLKALDINVTSWRSMAIGELMPSLVELNLLYDMASLFWVRLTRNASLSIGLGQTIRNCSASAYSVDKLYIYVTSMIEAVTPGPWGDDMVQGVVELDDALHQATSTPDSSKLVPIGQLNLENVTAQTWMRSFNAIVPSPTGITSSAIVNTTGLSNLQRAFVIFSKASSYVRAMHLIIVLTSDVVRYEFYDRYFDADKLGHYVTCTELVSQFFHDDYPSLEASLLIKDNRESKAQLLFQRTKSSVMFELRGNSNVSVDETQIARTLIKKIALLTFSPFNEFKNATRVFSDDFIRDMFIVRRKLAEARIRLGTNFNDTAERLSAIQWNGGLTYVKSTNSVVVASQNLVPAYFYVRQDQEHFNYGILATQFAKELLEALPDHFSTNTSCGNTLDFKLRRFTHAQRVELLRLSQAARASYRMYRDHFGSRSAYTWEEQVAIDRLFFQRFCTMFCSHALLEHRPSFLRMRHRCQMPLESMPEFQHAYQCASKADQKLATKAMCPPVEPMSS
ncbi:hypothetical protein IscW_ISCW010487 [Ixodes scapularis]|uniref:Peptidase M13 N-terminal domain-containing protein n=1 Tax=Ixodes scapularis TaxID=6945 RepID=B7Q813_IXOSC|nr:hypothetical protein IscW_ISCW010487 [Ixodes scapularis]|eukprot:XP_002404603.1 hypothetical protein IscW_ISCW010487 [Ixodes scapularis]